MTKNFNPEEASQMLAFAYAADLLGPHIEKGKIVTTPPLPQPNPLEDNGKTHAYPTPIWPEGWEPAFPSPNSNPWTGSVLNPELGTLLKVLFRLMGVDTGTNTVLACYNKELDAYSIAFAGTQNLLGVVEDLLAWPVSAGPLNFTYKGIGYKSDTYYYSNPDYYPDPPAEGEPKVIMPAIHLGFRLAVEQFTVNAKSEKYDLRKLFQKTGKKEINLFVTGHSLGGAMASLFAAWLQAVGIDGIKINVKTYTFAAPKTGNDSLINNFNLGATNKKMFFRVFNTLDSVPQIPFTLQTIYNLNNPGMISAFIPSGKDEADGAETSNDETSKRQWFAQKIKNLIPKNEIPEFSLPNLNYEHMGNPVALKGEFPVQFQKENFPEEYFPGISGEVPLGTTPKEINLMQSWWQHWPWVYKTLLDNSQNG